ncbi:HEPN domain-containing protein [Sphingomonas sp. So64.6b]|uniref:nucleotidyltransferase and HEPN domain-containing protein n=1 Tax=Sphingomonas sp. So64.6b TaxID=2997354 RepID=UPI0016031BA8|nr:nucleotidyltransferase and HEPN domain-containing protein [Sphingomonas sp. So64.6b]QNA83790.1 HEPN domain-containing protein [Sphingomonas sp. So64.6b]
MKNDVDHLPAVQQGELERVQRVLMEEFAEAIGRATTPSRKNGKILKIVLFGSHARDDWVDDRDSGYQSDFDLLVIVNHDDLTDIAHYWYVAEDRILRDATIARPVNIIVHSLDEVNQSLKRGEYFWVDIARDGVILYELPCHPLATPMPLTPADAFQMATAYFQDWLNKVDRSIRTVELQLREGGDDEGWRKDAAFMLHQATERAYICFLLVRTFYFPKSHNIKFLRSLAEDNEPRLIEAWPRDSRLDRRRFQLLKRAYVEARYSTAYEISFEELDAILACVRALRDIVAHVSRERLEELRAAAGA